MEITIWSGNLRSQVLEACNSKGCPPRHFALPDIKVDAFLNDIQGGLQKALSQDPLLKNQMMEAGASVTRDLAQLMAYWVGIAETEITKIAENTALSDAAKKTQMDGILGKLPNNLALTKQQILPKVQAAAMKVWDNLCRTRSEYRKYLIQAGLNIVAGTAKIIHHHRHRRNRRRRAGPWHLRHRIRRSQRRWRVVQPEQGCGKSRG